MTGDRRAIVVAGVCVLLLALLAGGGYVVWQRVQPDPGRLTLTVSGLPPGGSGNAVVEGPDGFRRSVTKTATLSVRPGAYTVRIKPARVGAATTYAVEEVLRTKVAASATATVPVAYKILIPDTTRVLDPRASGLLSPANGLTLAFEASTPALAGLRVGEMIVVAEGPKTPDLLVRKVVNVRRDGARLAVHTARARLEEAVPRGVLRFDDSSRAEIPGVRPAAFTNEVEGAVMYELDSWKTRFGRCGLSSPRLYFRIRDVDLSLKGSDLDWSAVPWAPYVELKLSVDTGYKVDVGFEAVLGGRCTAEREVKLAELPKRVAKLLKIGKVKVEVQLSALVEADVEIKGGAIVGFTQEVDAVASAVIRNTTVKKAENRSLPPRTTPVREPQVSAPVSGGVKAGLRFAYSVGDSLGVVGLGWAYDLTHGVRFVADNEGSAYVDQELGYAIRARIRLLGKTYNPKVVGVSVKFRVWTGGTTRPPVPSGTAYVLANFALYAKTNDEPARVVNPSVRGDVVLSPDGKRLAWADLSDLSKSTIPVMVSDLDGRNARQIAEEPNLGGLCSTPAWAPDSRRLLYPERAETADQPDLWATVDVASGERKQLSPGTGCHPVWSADGRTIAWYDHNPGTGSNVRLTDELGVTAAFVPHIGGVPDPCFNAFNALGPGGHRLLVDASDPSRHACGDGPGRGPYAGMVVDTKTGEKRELADETPLRSGVFLPDGRLLAQTSAGDLVLLGDRGQLLARMHDPVLGPDSHVLAYVPR